MLIDPVDAARAQEYALLAALLSCPPSQRIAWPRSRNLRGDVTPLGRAHAALAEAASEVTDRECRARIFRSVRRSRARRVAALCILLSDRLSQRASAVAPARRSRCRSASSGSRTISSRRIMRRRCARSWRALRPAAFPRRRTSTARLLREACNALDGPPVRRHGEVRRAPNSTDRSARSVACFWKSKLKHLRSRTDQ